MKKFVLIIIGIFFISLVSATVTIYKPNDPVTNLTATNISGSLEADTYLIRVVVLGNETANWGYRAQLRSPPSNMVNITLDSTGGIRLNWTNSTDGRATANYIFIKKGDTQWYMFTQMGHNGVIGESYDMTTYTWYKYRMDIWHNDSNSPDPNVPFGLNQWNGTGMIKITGDSPTLYFANIVTALKNAHGGELPDTIFYDGFYGFAGFWSIDSYDATSGSLSISYWDLWLMSLENGADFQIISIGNNIQQTSISFPMQAGAANYVNLRNANLQGITIDGGFYGMDTSYWYNTQMETTTDTFIQNSRIHLSFPKIRSADGFKNTHLFASNILAMYCGNEVDPVMDIQLMYGSIRFTSSSCGVNNLTFKNLYSNGVFSFDFDIRRNRAYSPYAGEVQIIDSTFDRDNNLPKIYYYAQGYNFRPAFVGK